MVLVHGTIIRILVLAIYAISIAVRLQLLNFETRNSIQSSGERRGSHSPNREAWPFYPDATWASSDTGRISEPWGGGDLRIGSRSPVHSGLVARGLHLFQSPVCLVSCLRGIHCLDLPKLLGTNDRREFFDLFPSLLVAHTCFPLLFLIVCLSYLFLSAAFGTSAPPTSHPPPLCPYARYH